MTSTTIQAGRSGRASFNGTQNSNAPFLPEKTKLHTARRSTPDSEALASSDDEHDQVQPIQAPTNSAAHRPARRSSWLSEVQPATQRKFSFTTGSLASTNSQPPTPSADVAPWPSGSHGPRSSNGASFPWSSQIWGKDPNRATDPLQSPTSLLSSAQNGYFANQSLTSPPVSRDLALDTAFPFAIPLHPTPKTYRSQSYSVGQMDTDVETASVNGLGQTQVGRMRGGGLSALRHRPSRPSMLSLHDPMSLGQVQEVEDDNESTRSSEQGVQLLSPSPRADAFVDSGHSALLKQAAVENARARQRVAAGTITSSHDSLRYRQEASPPNLNGAPMIESDYAIDEIEDSPDPQAYGSVGPSGRRFSEYGAMSDSRYQSSDIENRRIENIKRAQWQSSLGFGGIGDGQQSRRHSFADIPTRRGSSVSDTRYELGDLCSRVSREDYTNGYGDTTRYPEQSSSREYTYFRRSSGDEQEALERQYLHYRNYAASYFSGVAPALRSVETSSTVTPTSTHSIYGMQNPYGIPHAYGFSRSAQKLYIVSFKCARADVFYIQEGTGLQVKEGDLVIVEADRGTDLGTVTHANVPWSKAKELKDLAAEEHYRWLMMFSRHSQSGNPGATNPNGMMAHTNGNHGSAVGGMGPPHAGLHGMPDVVGSDLKPKMIKRLAQHHEISTLRDKEGNEAKAKRVCQQKVVEHRLNMEILDAEFQMDWKKLTFYYFADNYVNFNPLVTDLFKIWKTRIWMSAINPASFVTPSYGLQPPSGTGPGALLNGHDSASDPRFGPYHGFGGLGQVGDGNPGSPIASGNSFQPNVPSYYQATGPSRVSPTAAMADFTSGLQQHGGPFGVYSALAYQTPDNPENNAQVAQQYNVGFSLENNGAGRRLPQNERENTQQNRNRNEQQLGQDWTTGFTNMSLGPSQ